MLVDAYERCLLIVFLLSTGLLQLLFGREHRRVGPAQSDAGASVPGPHGRRFVHRHERRRHPTVDGRTGPHGALVGSARRKTTGPARFRLADLFVGLLPGRRLARRRIGEFHRRGNTSSALFSVKPSTSCPILFSRSSTGTDRVTPLFHARTTDWLQQFSLLLLMGRRS